MATQTSALSGNEINNEIYNELGERWYSAKDDPVALLRAESKLIGPWIQAEIAKHYGNRPVRVLDVGCGGGFNSNYMASLGHDVTGVDLSAESLHVARQHDHTCKAHYVSADATQLPFADGEFDVVLAMDFLEHVEDVERVISEISRVTRGGGLFFFHTFNRNPLAWLVNIKLVEWLVPNTPKNLHLLRMFLKPSEITRACISAGLRDTTYIGTKPRLGNLGHWFSILFKRQVPDDFSFSFTKSLLLSYCGIAKK